DRHYFHACGQSPAWPARRWSIARADRLSRQDGLRRSLPFRRAARDDSRSSHPPPARGVAPMKCPFCAELENKVIDSRLSNQGAVIRRRRECLGCSRRFTTYERVEEILPMVVKKVGRREAFDRQNVMEGLKIALQKRPVSAERLEEVVDGIERLMVEWGEE